jgi:hypothetical protein
MQSDFLKVEYTNNKTISAWFTWNKPILLQYNKAKYSINRAFVHAFHSDVVEAQQGTLTLLYREDKETKSKEILKAGLTHHEIESFSIWVKNICRDSKNAIILEQNINNMHYKFIEQLIYDKFPKSKIIWSWTDWINLYLKPTIWKPILGGLGLAGLGYAYYKYYHAK